VSRSCRTYSNQVAGTRNVPEEHGPTCRAILVPFLLPSFVSDLTQTKFGAAPGFRGALSRVDAEPAVMRQFMASDLVVVFGGSGFVGKQVVRALAKRAKRVRVAMRRPHLGADLRVLGDVGQIQLLQANVRYPESVAAALMDADAVVNLVAV